MADIKITGICSLMMLQKNGKLRKPGVVKKYTCLNTGYLNRSGDAVTIRVRKKGSVNKKNQKYDGNGLIDKGIF